MTPHSSAATHGRATRGLRLSSGSRCALLKPALPGLENYYVVSLKTVNVSATELAELLLLAQRIGRLLARQHHRDPECYTLLYNAGRTRRVPWPHVHVLIAPSVRAKRLSLLLFQLKHLLRWRKWRVVRWLLEVR